MWEQIDEAEQPLVAMAGDREVRLDEMALYLIESAGWKMLRENGFHTTVWVEKRPARDTTMPPAMDSEE